MKNKKEKDVFQFLEYSFVFLMSIGKMHSTVLRISHSSCIKAWKIITCWFLLTSFMLSHVKYFLNYEADLIDWVYIGNKWAELKTRL